MLLFRHTIPSFLCASSYLQALLNEGPIPEGGIEIPDGCLKQDLTLSSPQDLTDLLHTLRFWLLPELLFDSVELLRFAFKPVNHEYFLCAAEEFGDVFPFLIEMSEIVRREPQERVECAINHVHVVTFLVEELGSPLTEKAGIVAAQEGKVECLQYLHSRGMELSSPVCEAAYAGGNLDCVKYVMSNNTRRNYNSAHTCAANGHFECLRYVIRNLPPSDDIIDATRRAFHGAASTGQIKCLEKMLVEWNDAMYLIPIAYSASWNGRLDVLEFAVERGAFGEQAAQFTFAAHLATTRGHLHCLQFLHECGFALSTAVLKSAARGGDKETFTYLIEHHCPADTSACNELASGNFLELLQYARQHGCPWDAHTCARAAQAGNLAVLQYLHSSGCPWRLENIVIKDLAQDEDEDEDTEDIWFDVEDVPIELEHITRSAARAPTIDCLLYLVEQGLTLDPYCGVLAARSKCVDTLRYLHAQGYSWNEKGCAVAANRGAVECLKFLHEIGTPWDKRTCEHAGSLECLKYAHEHGCPWDEKTFKNACSAECYEYAAVNGCPGAKLSYFLSSQKSRL